MWIRYIAKLTNLLTIFFLEGMEGILNYSEKFFFFFSTGRGVYVFSFMRINVRPVCSLGILIALIWK